MAVFARQRSRWRRRVPPWRRWPAAYGKRNAIAANGCDRSAWPSRMAYRLSEPDRSAIRRDSTVVHAPKRGGSRSRSQPERLPYPRRNDRSPPAPARDGRLRQDSTQARHGRSLNRQAATLSERGSGLIMSMPSALGGRERAWRPSLRLGPGARIPCPAPRNGTGCAAARGSGWFQHGRCAAARYALCTHRCLGFLYVAEARSWLNSKFNIAQAFPLGPPRAWRLCLGTDRKSGTQALGARIE